MPSAAAQKAHAAIYAIGIAGPDFTPAPLQKLAAETGGSYRQASSSRELAQTYASVRDELSRTWQLTYLTSSRPGSKINLTATANGGVAHFAATLPGSSGAVGQAPPPASSRRLPTAVPARCCSRYRRHAVPARVPASGSPRSATTASSGGSSRTSWAAGRRKARRQEARAATRTRSIDAIEARVRQRQAVQAARAPARARRPAAPPGRTARDRRRRGIVMAILASLAGSEALITIVLMGSASRYRSATSRGRPAAACASSRINCRTC